MFSSESLLPLQQQLPGLISKYIKPAQTWIIVSKNKQTDRQKKRKWKANEHIEQEHRDSILHRE